jgi:hypothetical protein
MHNVCIYYDHLEYFTAIGYNLWPLGINCGHLVYFSHFGMFGPRKIWQPCLGDKDSSHRRIHLSNGSDFYSTFNSE